MTVPTRSGHAPGWRSTTAASVAHLDPGAFAFVMATGIVSTALAADRTRTASAVLLMIGAVGYVLLCAASLGRLVRWRQRLVSDLTGPQGFAFLTVVAASDVLSTRLASGRHHEVAGVLLVVAVAGWLALGYGIPLLLVTARRRRVSLGQVNGTWFLWVVASQSVAVAGASLAPYAPGRATAALASVCWAVGLVQYLLTAGLALARLLLAPATPGDLTPPYWIFMGAAAISVLAGARILALPEHQALLPHAFVLGLSLLLWSFCTWLIPLLLALGTWRHVLRRVPLRYETSLWSMVFPLGMYGVATRELGRASGRGWMVAVGHAEGRVAAVVWALVFLAMLAAAAGAVRRSLGHPADVGHPADG